MSRERSRSPRRHRLAGKVALITGASSGIGRGVALALASEGAAVVVCARRKELLDSLKAEIEAKGGRAFAKVMDVTSRDSVHKGVQEAEAEARGSIDILVNCAGVMYFTLMKNKKYEEWQQTIDVCVSGTTNCCGALFPAMVDRKCGHIVNISSDAARTIFPALTVYNAAKSYIQVLSKGLRAEAVGTGVRVTDVQPGDVATDLIVNNTDSEAAAKVGVTIGKTIGAEGTRNSFLDVSDVADVVVYAVTAPQHVGVHEILIEPRDQMFGDPTSVST
ncbi:unnamed protein product [Polarella glacialis]|uniref:NADP-dependent 3-hydroxy acid dehydrogenase YdfG n=1 Tax=Polarella glacialis TaxID=89957 RepID=A0A813E9A6_POLGL|nr:unnamed protein product [Polarella glacialis]CAE8666411.1 unnamed protein product [Polarella glacialis]